MDYRTIDAFLATLGPEEQAEARAAAENARRAEERAEQRAIEKALEEKRRQRAADEASVLATAQNNNSTKPKTGLVYVPKHKRIEAKIQPQEPLLSSVRCGAPSHDATSSFHGTGWAVGDRKRGVLQDHHRGTANLNPYQASDVLTETERLAIQSTYLGKSALGEDHPAKKKKKRTGGTSKKINFRFRWDETDDTFANNNDDPLYVPVVPNRSAKRPKQDLLVGLEVANMETVVNKPVSAMTVRDWRIFRENYSITVKGGKSPPPMRSFAESPSPILPTLHPCLLDAIVNVLKFKEPSPIQRQAIPIGLQRRDLIGIAETGSGKTVAFGVPLCQYLLQLASLVLQSVAVQGPLALVLAPTRELAQQIDAELQKLLSRQNVIRSFVVVGGQPIQNQAQEIRRGIHILVGTPGRINDCIKMSYLVLNQCCYVVMDEADRMIDMGFAPQIESILDSMGGSLKSENENETYQQELEDLKEQGVAKHRLTAMFSATMPTEVEQMAQRYLRHPVVVSIGDKDSRKNSRIKQELVWLSSPSRKENALRDLMRDQRFIREKIIVFVNEKKHADSVGRIVERAGRKCVVMHGGKSQDQREENLEIFRAGGCVMVATDVAGRGLDIPDVAHVINYDLPTRSIENYTHRIGRTGRAGKEGVATSLVTDEDEGIMPALKAYLESTGNTVPQRLSQHPAVQATVGTGNIIF